MADRESSESIEEESNQSRQVEIAEEKLRFVDRCDQEDEDDGHPVFYHDNDDEDNHQEIAPRSSSSSRPRHLSVTLFKETVDAVVGIGMQESEDGLLRVTSLHPHGLLAVASNTIEVNDEVVSVNGTNVHNKGSKFAVGLIRESVGQVTIVVRTEVGNVQVASSTIVRPDLVTPIGIGLATFKDDKTVRISRVGGLCKHSVLYVGDELISVNGTRYNTVSEAISFVKSNSSGRVLTFLTERIIKVEVVPVQTVFDETIVPANDEHVQDLTRSLIGAGGSNSESASSSAACISAWVMNSRPHAISLTLIKETVDTKVGIGIKEIDDVLRVSSIAPNGLIAQAPDEKTIQIFDEVVNVNGFNVEEEDAKFAARLLRETVGPVTITVHVQDGNEEYAMATIVKRAAADGGGGVAADHHHDRTLGLGFVRKQGSLYVNSVGNGLYQNSLLRVGDQVGSINGLCCANMDVATALRLINGPDDRILSVVVFRETPSKRPELISASVHKPSIDTTVGLGMRVVNDEVRVTSIAPRGLFAKSPIRPGDTILSINKVRCSVSKGRDAVYCSKLIRSAVGSVTVVVRVKGGNPHNVSCMISKPSHDSQVGIGISRQQGAHLMISTVSGMLEDSLLNTGDRIISINDHDVCDSTMMTSYMAIAIIRNAPETVTIVTRNEDDTANVISSSMRGIRN